MRSIVHRASAVKKLASRVLFSIVVERQSVVIGGGLAHATDSGVVARGGLVSAHEDALIDPVDVQVVLHVRLLPGVLVHTALVQVFLVRDRHARILVLHRVAHATSSPLFPELSLSDGSGDSSLSVGAVLLGSGVHVHES